MKLPIIKKATWEIYGHPDAKWIVVERKYKTYSSHTTIWKALRKWLWHLGYIIGVK